MFYRASSAFLHVGKSKKKKDASQFFLPLPIEGIFYILYGSFFKLTFLLHVKMKNFCSFFPSPPTLLIINEVNKISEKCTILNRLIWSSLLSRTIKAPVSFVLHQST